VRFSGAEAARFQRATASGVGAAFTLGLLAGIGSVLAGVALGGPVGASLIALGVAFPGLTTQDSWRLVFFAEGRPQAAALNDAAWAIVQLTAVSALLLAGVNEVGPLVLSWGLAAAVAALLGVRQSHVRPRPRETARWLRKHRDLTGYLLAEFVTLQGGHQTAMLLIASLGSLDAIGALRGAQVILGPTTILAVGMYSFALPEFSRRRADLTAAGWIRGGAALSGFVTLLGLAWGCFFLLLPDVAGEALLGESWEGTKAVLLASVVGQAGAAIVVGPATMLYAMDRAKVTLRIHAVLAPLILTRCGRRSAGGSLRRGMRVRHSVLVDGASVVGATLA
jgi:O-antigen/teichoic acid export membrane protein